MPGPLRWVGPPGPQPAASGAGRGLRRGELLALRWDDIDLRYRQLHVRRTMQRVDGKLQVAEPKTSSSRRTVVLPQFAVRHLQEHKKRQDAERQALGDAWRKHGLVFVSSIGTPIEPRNVNRRWDELRRKAGLDWLRLHDLRHYADAWVMCPAVKFPLVGVVAPVLESA